VKPARIFSSFAGLLFFGCAALAAIRLVVADSFSRQDTLAAVTKAIALSWPTPVAEFEQIRAELDPGRARQALDRAVGANPRSSAAWIELGLLEEADDDFPAAECSLRQAERIDHQYLPAWTLANFYFRRADHAQF
jgi:tetratricopeptide (TPR) repeat protein